MPAPDVAIIGAGCFGLAAAWAFLDRGASVHVYEASHPGAGASGGLIGALSPHVPENWNPKKAYQLRALLSAEPFWRAVEQQSGQPTGYGRIGRILPLHSAAARDRAQARAISAAQLWRTDAIWRVMGEPSGMLAEQGAENQKDRATTQGIPGSGAFGWVHETLSARIYPSAAMGALAAAVKARGAVFHYGRVEDPAEIAAGAVIIAAGHQSPALCPTLPDGVLRGVKGQSALLRADVGARPIIFDDGIYVVPQGAYGVAVGSTSEQTWQSAISTDEGLDHCIARARHLLPILHDAPVVARWAGIRPRGRFPDPALGPVPGRPGQWLMTGGFKIGIGLCHTLAQDLAAMVAGETPDLPERFHLDAHLGAA